MKKTLFLLSFLFIAICSFSQVVPAIEWSKCLGGSLRESVNAIVATPDGGSILAGSSNSLDGDVVGLHGTSWFDFWIVKLDSTGSIQWKKCYGGTSTEIAADIKITNDGGYIICGYAISADGDVSSNHGGVCDAWVVKIDAGGTIQWEKCYGGNAFDKARRIITTSDGGYAFVGGTLSNNGDVSGHHDTTTTDIWVVKLDSAGTLEWQRCLGGTNWDEGYGIIQMDDNSFWVIGEAWSINFDASGNHGYYDYCLVHLSTTGTTLGAKVYGGSDQEFPRGILKTNYGFVAYGYGSSTNGNVVGNINYYDYWILGCDTLGNIIWQKCLGGTGNEGAYIGALTPDNGLLFTGYCESNNINVSGNHGGQDAWLIKTDSIGNLQWQVSLGGALDDNSWAVAQLDNNKIIVAANTKSSNGNIVGSHGDDEIWVAQLSSNYNAITGNIYYDINSNNIKDIDEPSLSNRVITETTTGRIALSDYRGNYEHSVFQPGSYDVISDTIQYFVSNPASHNALFFSNFGLVDSLNDFAVQPDIIASNDLESNLYIYSAFRPGFDAYLGFDVRNLGNAVSSGTITIHHDTSLVFASSLYAPLSVSTDSIVFSVDSIKPFETEFGYVKFTVSPTIGIGTALFFESEVTSPSDLSSINNIDTTTVITRGSFDPNDKMANRSEIDETIIANRPAIDYTIRFQNTGTDTAFNIVVLDTLSQMLDMSTFELLSSSHPVQIEYTNQLRLLHFNFKNILLPDSNTNEELSHGIINFRIKPYNTIQYGDAIANAANIYFDYNESVRTNTWLIPLTRTTAINEISNSETLFLYPNPSNDFVWLRFPNSLSNAQLSIYNQLGQNVKSIKLSSDKVQQISVANLNSGIYFFNVNDGTININSTFIKKQ